MKNLGQFKSSLLLRAGNLSSTDPVWTGSNNGADFVNEAQNMVALRTLRRDRRRLNMFPELIDRWHVQQDENVARLILPDKWLTLDEVYSYDIPRTDPEPSEHLNTRRLVEYIDEDRYEQHQREAEPTGWALGWTRMGDYWYTVPTPGVGWASWMLVKGLKYPPTLSVDSDTPIFKDPWQAPIEDAAAYLLFKKLGWDDDAAAALSSLDTSITNTVDILGMNRQKRKVTLKIKGRPRGF